MFFDTGVFLSFVADCRAWGITCPIVPGLMCINAYAGFAKMTKFCKTRVPASLNERIQAIKDDPAAVKEFGIQFGTEMCQDLVQSNTVNVLHFYTLNLEKVVYGVLDALGWSENALSATNEADAASQVAKGSAWARVGDTVQTKDGDKGVVVELNEATGEATVQLAEEQKMFQKGDYTKVF